MKKYINILIIMVVLLAVVFIAKGQSDSNDVGKRTFSDYCKDFISHDIEKLTKYSLEELNKYSREYERIRALDDDVASLWGVKGITVVVNEITEDGNKCGLDKKKIQTKVELKLRLVGIKVPSNVVWSNDTCSSGFLYITINTLGLEISDKDQTDFYFHDIDVSFRQPTKLLKVSPNDIVLSETWGKGYLSSAGKNISVNYVYDTLDDIVDSFINDYLEANPKSGK